MSSLTLSDHPSVRVELLNPPRSGVIYFRAPESFLRAEPQEPSARDLRIIRAVYDCRLMSANQIQELVFSGEGDPQTNARLCRKTLRRLTEQDILRRRQRQIGGLRAGSQGYIYSLGSQGVKLVTDKRLHYYVHDPSEYFMKHTLALSGLYVQMHQEGQDGKFELLDIQTEPSCWRVFLTLATGRRVLKPDMYVKLGVGDEELSYFVELDRGTTFATALNKKLRTYENYYFTGKEQQEFGMFPQVLWLVPDEKRKAVLEALCEPFNARVPGLFVVVVKGGEIDVMLGDEPP
jgi:hypothetical protein